MKIIGRKGQMTIFVIIAIVIVAAVVIYFLVRGNIKSSWVSPELTPVFDYYKSCIEAETRSAIKLAESQGGYIDVPPYKPGSEYAPFSSELNFLGFSVPYWYYVSGNGLIKEQVPSETDIEEGIASYLEERVNDCNFDSFYAQGFYIDFGEPTVNVKISNEKVDVEVLSDLSVFKGETSGRVQKHDVSINSKLGKFYGIARKIYAKEKTDAIFDNYGLDVLRLYTPVDGVEISCSGKIWKTRNVINELKSGLEANIAAIKFKGNYYSLNEKKNKYYEVNLGTNIDESVNLIYTKNMPSKIEINGDGVDDELMIASPVGNQEGLGVMGFCYAPYHFIYDVRFPVLVQIYNNEEMFQFPIVAIIDKNLAREGIFSEIEGETGESDLCGFMTKDIQVNLYDTKLNGADGDITYQCFDQKCRLGQSSGGKFVGKAPACLNGYLIVKSDGFVEKKELFSTNGGGVADIILDREYNVSLDLKVGGKPLSGIAIITFAGKNGGRTISTALPDSEGVKLSEGMYDVSVYVYGNSSIIIPSSTKTQCQEVPRSGILGFFGSTKEECFDITIPETKIEYALRGGGKSEVYLLESQLESGKLEVEVDELPLPDTLEQLQYNYGAFDSQGVSVT